MEPEGSRASAQAQLVDNVIGIRLGSARLQSVAFASQSPVACVAPARTAGVIGAHSQEHGACISRPGCDSLLHSEGTVLSRRVVQHSTAEVGQRPISVLASQIWDHVEVRRGHVHQLASDVHSCLGDAVEGEILEHPSTPDLVEHARLR